VAARLPGERERPDGPPGDAARCARSGAPAGRSPGARETRGSRRRRGGSVSRSTTALPRAARLYLWGIALTAGAAMVAWVWAWTTRYAGALGGGPDGGPDGAPDALGGLVAPGPPAFGDLGAPLVLGLFGVLLLAAVVAQLNSLQLGPRRKVNVAIGVYFAG